MSYYTCCKAGLVLLNSLNFCLSGKLWFLHQIWMRILPGIVLFDCRFFLLITFIYIYLPLRNMFITLWEFPCVLFVIFSLLLSVFYLGLLFLSIWLLCVLVCSSLTVSCLGLYTSWTWLTIFFFTWGKFSSIFPSNIFLGSFSVSSPSGTPIMWILIHLTLSQRSLRRSSLKKFFFFYIQFCHNDFHHSVFQVTDSFFCLNYSVTDFF